MSRSASPQRAGGGGVAYQLEATLQAASDFIIDAGRDALDTAAAGETSGRVGVSFGVSSGFFKVSSHLAVPRPDICRSNRNQGK